MTLILLLWLAGGWLLIEGMRSEGLAGETSSAIRRCDPAAIAGLILFMAVWPVIFVAARLADFSRRF